LVPIRISDRCCSLVSSSEYLAHFGAGVPQSGNEGVQIAWDLETG